MRDCFLSQVFARGSTIIVTRKFTTTVVLTIWLLFLTASQSTAIGTKNRKRDAGLNRIETNEVERRLSEMGYWTGPVDGVIDGITRTALVAFQKWEGRNVTSRFTRDDLEAVRNATSPQARANYFSDGLAIHGNPSVPPQPKSHGCIRIPMFAAREVSKLLPVGTIVLIYDKDSFVSAKDWAEADKQKQAANMH